MADVFSAAGKHYERTITGVFPGNTLPQNIKSNISKKITAISESVEVAIFLMRSVSRPWKGLDQCIQYGYFSSFFFRQEELFVSSYDVFPSLRLTKMLCFFFDPLEHIGVGEHQVNEIVVASLAVTE